MVVVCCECYEFEGAPITDTDFVVCWSVKDTLARLLLTNDGRSSSSTTSKHTTSRKPRIRRRSISIKEKRPLLARSA